MLIVQLLLLLQFASSYYLLLLKDIVYSLTINIITNLPNLFRYFYHIRLVVNRVGHILMVSPWWCWGLLAWPDHHQCVEIVKLRFICVHLLVILCVICLHIWLSDDKISYKCVIHGPRDVIDIVVVISGARVVLGVCYTLRHSLINLLIRWKQAVIAPTLSAWMNFRHNNMAITNNTHVETSVDQTTVVFINNNEWSIIRIATECDWQRVYLSVTHTPDCHSSQNFTWLTIYKILQLLFVQLFLFLRMKVTIAISKIRIRWSESLTKISGRKCDDYGMGQIDKGDSKVRFFGQAVL